MFFFSPEVRQSLGRLWWMVLPILPDRFSSIEDFVHIRLQGQERQFHRFPDVFPHTSSPMEKKGLLQSIRGKKLLLREQILCFQSRLHFVKGCKHIFDRVASSLSVLILFSSLCNHIVVHFLMQNCYLFSKQPYWQQHFHIQVLQAY